MEVRPVAHLSRHRLCACGCGRPVSGRRTRKFYSDACRVRAHRGSGPDIAANRPRAAENPLHSGRAVSQGGDVTLSDTKLCDVRCVRCGSQLAGLRGPLQEPAYCRRCVPAI